MTDHLKSCYTKYKEALKEFNDFIDSYLNTNPKFNKFEIKDSENGYYEIYSEIYAPNIKSHILYANREDLYNLIIKDS